MFGKKLFASLMVIAGTLAFGVPLASAAGGLPTLGTKSNGLAIQVQAAAAATVRVKDAHLREQPTSKSTLVATLPRGTKLQVLDTASNGWLHVTAGDKTGYISNKLVTR